MTVWRILWRGSYVIARQTVSRGYTRKLSEAKVWKSRANAERFLKRKDPSWAASCTIQGGTEA